jgi:hypothetical protein
MDKQASVACIPIQRVRGCTTHPTVGFTVCQIDG